MDRLKRREVAGFLRFNNTSTKDICGCPEWCCLRAGTQPKNVEREIESNANGYARRREREMTREIGKGRKRFCL